MKKSDLVNGMIIEFGDKSRGMVVGDLVMEENFYSDLDSYDENLNHVDPEFISDNPALKICKIYDRIFVLKDLENLDESKILWKRRPEDGEMVFIADPLKSEFYQAIIFQRCDSRHLELLDRGLVCFNEDTAIKFAKEMIGVD